MKLKDITAMREATASQSMTLVATDPSVTRGFKEVPILNEEGVVVDYNVSKFDPHVLPNPSDVFQSVPVDMTDPIVAANIAEQAQKVNLQTSPNVSPIEAAQYCKEVKTNMSNPKN